MKKVIVKKNLIAKVHKDRIDSLIERENVNVKRLLCSVVKCENIKLCPFYHDPKTYEQLLIKDKLPKSHCSFWSDYPNILEELDKIKTEVSKKVLKKDLKKDLQKQLVFVDKTLKEISDRWSIRT